MADKIQYIQVPAPDLPQQRVNEVGYLPPTATNANPSISLKEYFDSQIAEKEKRYEQRFTAQQEAILKADLATEKRFESVNEFRSTLKDQQLTFLPRAESEAKFEFVNKNVEKNQSDINNIRLGLSNFLSISEYTLRHAELQAQVTILRDAMNTNQGKTTIADPVNDDKFTSIVKTLDTLGARISSLQETRSINQGGSDRGNAIWGYVVGGVGGLVGVILLILRLTQ